MWEMWRSRRVTHRASDLHEIVQEIMGLDGVLEVDITDVDVG
jgi:hypothetical protein